MLELLFERYSSRKSPTQREKRICLYLVDIAGSELLWGTVLLGQRHHPASLFRHQQMRDPVPVPVALKMTMCNIDFYFYFIF